MAKYDLGATLAQMREFAAAVVEGGAAGRERFETGRRTQVWVEHHLLLLGEATHRIRTELDAAAPGVPWGAVVGLRTVIVHGYDRVRRDRSWATVVDDVPELLRTIEALLSAERQ